MNGLHIFTRDHRLTDNTSLIQLLKKCDKIIFAAFGGGFTWGSVYLTWAYNS